jgi:hypothetical protein
VRDGRTARDKIICSIVDVQRARFARLISLSLSLSPPPVPSCFLLQQGARVLEADTTKSELADAKQTIVALKQQMRTLLQQEDRQTSSTADAAASDASSPPDHRAEPPAMPHALMLALRGLDDAGLRREFDKHADPISAAAADAGPGSKDKDTERRMSKAGLASFMRDQGLAHGDADVGRAMERVDTNGDGVIDYGEFCALSQANSDLEKVLQAKHLECILCYYFPRGTTLEDLGNMDRAQFSTIVKLSQQTMVQLLVDLAAQVAAVGKAQDGAGGSKFTGELRGGTLENFNEGATGVCGEPDADIEKGMLEEHTLLPGSDVEFSTSNYGLTTTPSKEWALVLEGGSGCAEVEGKECSVIVTGTRGCCKASGLKVLNTGNADPCTLGLKWQAVGDTQPTEGRQLTNSTLARKLARKTAVAARQQQTKSVSFTDTEGDRSTLKIDDATHFLSWHAQGRCFLVRDLEFRSGVIRAPEHSALTARLVDPAPGPARDRLLRDIAIMSRSAGGVGLVGFPIDAHPMMIDDDEQSLKDHVVDFTKEDLDLFGITDLRSTDFIKAGGAYFKPLAVGDMQPDVRVLRPIAYYGDFGEDGRLKWGVGDVVVVGEQFTVPRKVSWGDDVKFVKFVKDTEGTVLEFNAEGDAKIAFCEPSTKSVWQRRVETFFDGFDDEEAGVKEMARMRALEERVSGVHWVSKNQFYRLFPLPNSRDTPIQRRVKQARLRRCDVLALILYTGRKQKNTCLCTCVVPCRASACSPRSEERPYSKLQSPCPTPRHLVAFPVCSQ